MPKLQDIFHVAPDEEIKNELLNESEAAGIAHQSAVHGWNLWKQCSYNTVTGIYYQQNEDGTMTEASDQSKAFRKNYPGMGDTYDPTRDAFILPRPENDDGVVFNSWTINETTMDWEAPTPEPSTQTNGVDDLYHWNEGTQSWDKEVIWREGM